MNPSRHPANLRLCLAVLAGLAGGLSVRAENEYENAPINYSETAPDDAAQRLEKAQVEGKVRITREDDWSILRQVLKHFDIPFESQVMVFSKTSKQNDRINPETPRVVYFGDNAYVGYCLGGAIEVSVVDAKLGPIFYLLDPHVDEKEPLRFQRDQSCLSCHGGPFSPEVPGVIVRSVYPGPEGHPIMSQGSTVVDTTTPFEERWGGYYVTGKHGDFRHRGNVTAEENGESVTMDLHKGANATSLERFFDTSPYPRKVSDIVALMVLEHQTSTQNILTKANHTSMRAMYMQKNLQRELGEKVLDEPVGTARRIIDHCTEDVLDAILFKDEAALPPGGIEGDVAFQQAFSRNGPQSSDGRSLKDFQLLSRLFKYRCSYMVYSITFRNLMPQLKQSVLDGLWKALEQGDPGGRYGYLTASERKNIQRILVDTLPDAPAAWRQALAAR